MKHFVLTSLVVLFSLVACGQQDKDRLSPVEFKNAIAKGGVQLVDVRTPEEFTKGHLEGAVNIDWLADGFMGNTTALDKAKPVLLYCAGGGRSEEALRAMQKAGFKNAHDMVGGITAWKKEGSPVTTK